MNDTKVRYRGDLIRCAWCGRMKQARKTGGVIFMICDHCDLPCPSPSSCPSCDAISKADR